MKLDGEFVFEAAVQDVWDALFDPQVLAAVLPGCEKLDLVDGSYVGELKVKVGPIQGKFTGKVDLLDLKEPTSYRMVIDGRGAQGFVKASATIRLEALGDKTRIRYESEAQVGGKIASVGQRLVETSARAIVKQSLEGLHENIKLRVAAHLAQVPAAKAPVAVTEAAPPVTEVAPAVTEAAPAVKEAKPAAAPEPPGPPIVEYKRADPTKLAGAVAREVTRTLAPIILLVVAVLGAVVYFFIVR